MTQLDRRLVLTAPIAMAALAATRPAAALPAAPVPFHEPTETIPLWTGTVPGNLRPGVLLKEVNETVPLDKDIPTRRISKVSRPRMSVFPGQQPNGASVLIIPGGGFAYGYYDHEGYDLAYELAQQGITCFVLFYRLANDGWENRPDIGTIDAQRAMRVIRANASRFKLDPERVAVIGFSAGGYIAGSLATRHAQPLYSAADQTDQLSARPNLAGLMYSVLSLDPAIAWNGAAPSLFGGTPTDAQIMTYAPDHNVSSTTPATFLAQADDDNTVPPENSLRFRAALRAAGIPSETHLFVSGGHGFGMKRRPAEPYHIWPTLFVNFARHQGLFA